jgi:transposase
MPLFRANTYSPCVIPHWWPPTKDGGNKRGVQSRHAAPAVLGREASRVVRQSGGTVRFGRHQWRENKVPPHHLSAAQVENIITSPPQQDPYYTKLQTELLNWLSPSREQRVRQLLTLEAMDERKPSHYLRYLRNLGPECQTTSCAASGLAGYPSTFKPLSLANPGFSLTPRPTAQTASPRPSSRLRSPTLADQPATPNYCIASRSSLARWRLSAVSRTTPRYRECSCCSRVPSYSSRDPDYNPRDRLPHHKKSPPLQQIALQRSRVRFPALSDFLRSNVSGMGSTQPREYNWGAAPV